MVLITELFNLTLVDGDSADWEQAEVILFPQNEDHSYSGSDRPVSLTSVVYKVHKRQVNTWSLTASLRMGSTVLCTNDPVSQTC